MTVFPALLELPGVDLPPILRRGCFVDAGVAIPRPAALFTCFVCAICALLCLSSQGPEGKRNHAIRVERKCCPLNKAAQIANYPQALIDLKFAALKGLQPFTKTYLCLEDYVSVC